MGCDITILHKHDLDISSIEKLAIDLHNRLGISIEYGYYASKEYNALLGNDLDEGFIVIGYLKSEPFIQKYILTDEKFQKKQLLEKFGDALYEITEYWNYENGVPDQKRIDVEKIENKIAEYDLEGSSSHLFIYNDVVSNGWVYYSRWWHFCDTIQNKYIFEEDNYQQFRQKIMKITHQLGGNKAYFVNDQCRHLKGVGQGDEMYYGWDELEHYINSIETLTVVSVSKVVLDYQYKYNVIGKKQDTLAFVDDFEDLIFANSSSSKDEMTEKMHSEFTISKETEIKHLCWSALERIYKYNYTLLEVCEVINVTPEQIELHRQSYEEISNLKKFYISKNNFSDLEQDKFQKDFGYGVTTISYYSKKEIDFTDKEEKSFLLKNGLPKLLARFGF